MKRTKKVIASMLSVAMIASMAACTVSADASDFDGTLNVGIPGDPADLGPFSTMSVGRMYTLETVYEYLGCFEEMGGDYVGWLASDIEVSDDALTVVVTIYDYITDAAGNNITSSDVKWVFDSAIEANCSIQLGYVDSVDIIDDYTVQFNMNSAIVNGWQNVLSSVPIISQATYEANEDTFAVAPITTSAYTVTDFIAGSTLSLELRDDYWQTDDSLNPVKHNVDAIEFDVIADSSQMAIALETGAIEVAEGMSTSEVERFMEGGESSEGYTTFNALGTMVYSLLFNCSDENGVFAGNDTLRQAIAYAIDVDAILEGILNGGGVKCTTWGGYEADDFNPDWVDSYYEYDVEKAQELLTEAGYSAGELTLRMEFTSDSILSSIGEMIQAYLGAIGVNVELNSVDSGLFDSTKYDDTEWDLLLDTIGGENLALLSKSYNSVDKSYLNISFANDSTLQELAETIVNSSTHTEEICQEWVEYMNEKLYAYGLFNVYSYVATKDFVTDVTFTTRAALYPGDTVIG
ncbi:MAG: ABC transporter substrate-binding protein [Lachnospiraceae bacterium]|nr:ABC transporter substrate-binding protein [Lachnospiraceae bacterium]